MVLAIMMLVIGPLTDSFVSGMHTQIAQTNIYDAQENARMALERMRKDIHCAHGVNTPLDDGSGGQTLILTETNVSGTAECPNLIQVGASAVQWCTVAVPGAPDRYILYRESDANQLCDGSTATFQVDYLTTGTVWTTPACPSGEYPTVDVSLPIDVDPTNGAAGMYSLHDRIALRNATTCT